MVDYEYLGRVAAFAAAIREDRKPEKFEYKTPDDHARGAIAHFSGNTLVSRAVYFTDNTIPLKSAQETQRVFVDGLNTVEPTILTPEVRHDFERIKKLGEEGNWDDLGFLLSLNKKCVSFVREEKIDWDAEQDIPTN